MSLAQSIEHVLLAACVGDALGAATECMHRDEIPAIFGGPVRSLVPPPPRSPFAKGLTPGSLTDDATQLLAMAEIALRTGGAPDVKDAVAGLLLWSENLDIAERFSGPTTRLALAKLKAGAPLEAVNDPGVYSTTYGTSNGGAMRAPLAGCLAPAREEAAARLAAVFAAPTHNTLIAFAGAGAIAAAVAHGLGGGSRTELGRAALTGVATGEAEAHKWGRITAGPDVGRRIALALDIGETFKGRPQAAMTELEAIIGNGVAMAEAVPCAFGLAVASEFSPWAAILAAVNGGNDSDTIAMLAGAVAAAYGGNDIDLGAATEVIAVNHLDLRSLSAALAGIAHA